MKNTKRIFKDDSYKKSITMNRELICLKYEKLSEKSVDKKKVVS